ncbi:MAG: sigma-70 family RNA polymerase sigma factor [Acidimicrobiales bacterium]
MNSNRRTDLRASASITVFESFYRDHYAAISRYVARRLPPSSHDEVVAATFVIAWQKFAQVPEPSLTWLYRIASYEVAHERRRMGRHPEAAQLNDLHLIDSSPLQELFDVSRAFSQLSESDADLLRLIYWENLSRSEIAEVLGTSVNAVNVRCHRALERLAGAASRLANLDNNPSSKEAP